LYNLVKLFKNMKDLNSLLKLKEDNINLINENNFLRNELETNQIKFEQILSIDKAKIKVVELKMLLDKCKKEKNNIQNMFDESKQFAEQRNEEILSALINGSYGITFEDFIVSLSEDRYLKIPIDTVFGNIKNEVYQKFASEKKLKLDKLDKTILKYEQKQELIKDKCAELENFFNLKIKNIKSNNKKKLLQEKEKHNLESISLKNQYILRLKKIREKLNVNYINGLEYEIEKLKEQNKKEKKDNEKLMVSHNLLKKEISELEENNKVLSTTLDSIKIKLQNCQKELAKYISKQKNISSSSILNSNLGDMNISSENDGSKGWHSSARENGKFGSLPSFDNYDDEYLDNSKEGFE
jgi:hypothetical protein